MAEALEIFGEQAGSILVDVAGGASGDYVRGAIQSFLERESDLKAAGVTRLDTIVPLLKGLRAFAADHFSFFYRGFRGEGDVFLERSQVFPVETALARIVNQMTEDAEIIMRAAHQRGIKEYRDRLAIADTLAYRALSQAEETLGIQNGRTAWNKPFSVLTYFQKSAEIRVVPYLPVALIGIPLTALLEPRDLLAIPHEVGHYIYHHRQFDHSTDAMDHAFTETTTELGKWQEEVFADVCAAALAGGIMAFDFQEVSKRYHRELFIRNDGEHPPPFMRPLIYTHVLRTWGAADTRELANALDERWGRVLAARWSKPLDLPEGTPFSAVSANIQASADALQPKAHDPALSPTLTAEEIYLLTLGKALSWIGRNGERPTLGADMKRLVEQAMARIDFGDDWTVEKAKMLEDLNDKREDADKYFVQGFRSLTTGAAPVPPLPVTDQEINQLWQEWVKREEFFNKQLPGDLPIDPAIGKPKIGVGQDEFLFFRHPTNPPPTAGQEIKPTWQPLWFAGTWTTGPADSPGRPP